MQFARSYSYRFRVSPTERAPNSLEASGFQRQGWNPRPFPSPLFSLYSIHSTKVYAPPFESQWSFGQSFSHTEGYGLAAMDLGLDLRESEYLRRPPPASAHQPRLPSCPLQNVASIQVPKPFTTFDNVNDHVFCDSPVKMMADSNIFPPPCLSGGIPATWHSGAGSSLCT